MDYVATIAGHLLPIILTILAGVLTLLGTYALRWLRKRLGLERLVADDAITAAVAEIVAGGVAYAEQAERRWRRGFEPPPADSPRAKLDAALEWAAREIRRRELPEQARDRLVDMIEARLGSEPRTLEFVSGEADK